METDVEALTLQALALSRAAVENARMKGEMAVVKTVIGHLLAAASDEVRTEAHVALQLLLQRLRDGDADVLAGAQETVAVYLPARPAS